MKKTFWLLGLLLMLSCNKGNIQYSFSGIVLENVGQTALSGVDISIYQIPFNNALTSTNFVLAGKSNSGNGGLFQLSFDREKATEFKIEMTRDDYFDHVEEFTSEDISSQTENIFNATMDAKSWINFDINNAAPANQSDDLTLVLYNYRKDCDDCATSDYNYFSGIVDSNVTYVSTAGQYFKFMFINVSTGQSTLDSVYMTPFDTTNYVFTY